MPGAERTHNQIGGDTSVSGSVVQARDVGEIHFHGDQARDARAGVRPGRPLDEVSDPFVLEVHRPIGAAEATGLDALPVYVRRAHDERLAKVVARAGAGGSAMAVLVAGSSAGKTRACWEALEPLRRAGGWWLWHPYDPTRPDAALEALDRVEPHTVVWLNETQDYLGAGGEGERIAAKLRSLLTDPARAPVLVLGTLWPKHHAALTERPESQVRLVLDGTVIEVPETFAGTDLAALNQAAATDPRLALAAERADEGQITQYLAGGPALIERFYTAPPAAKALIWAAMDARRLGHRNALPLALLEEAAQAYLTDIQWDQLGEDWMEQALAYTSRPCKGTQGPLVRIRPHRTRSRTTAAGGPMYRLADYLDQHGRTDRAGLIPPIGFWTAAAAHAHLDDLNTLGDAAWNRGMYRDATQLHKNATAHGDPRAADTLVRRLHALHPNDHRPAHWAATHTTLDRPGPVGRLLHYLWKAGAVEQLTVLAERAATHVPLGDPTAVGHLLRSLRRVGAQEQVTVLLARNPAAHITLDDPRAVEWLLGILREIGADEQVAVLLARDPAAHVTLDNPHAVGDLLDSLGRAGAREQVAVLLSRSPAAHVSLDNPTYVGWLLHSLRRAGADEQLTALAERAATHMPLDNSTAVAELLDSLRRTGTDEQLTALATRAAARIPLDNPTAVAHLLDSLRKTGADEQLTALATRAATHIPLDNRNAVGHLLDGLQRAGADEQLNVLAERAAAHFAIDDPAYVSWLLARLRKTGQDEQATVLLARTPAAHVTLDDPTGVAWLLGRLRTAGADEQLAALATRAAAHIPLDDPPAVGHLLDSLRELGADEQLTVLLARDPAAHVTLDDPRAVRWLLDSLQRAGADEQLTALATRAAAHIPLDDPDAVGHVLHSLQMAGASEQVTMLAERFPAAGLFWLFMDIGDNQVRFRFGREPDTTAAAPWGWDDLE